MKLALHAIFMLLFVTNAMAADPTDTCFSNAEITFIEVGWSIDNGSQECPDAGNCIHFGYKEPGQPEKNTYINYGMNLKNGQKGMVMYDLLKTALVLGYKVEGKSEKNYCTSYDRSISSLKIRPY